MLTRGPGHALIRLCCSFISCSHTTVAGYSGTSDSDKSTKRWLRESSSENSSSALMAIVSECVPQCVCSDPHTSTSAICMPNEHTSATTRSTFTLLGMTLP